MKLRIFIISLTILLFSINSCGSKKKELNEKYGLEEKEKKKKAKHKPTLAEIFGENIMAAKLDFLVNKLADSSMEGRETGKRGAKKAAKFIWDYFVEQKLVFPKELDGYFQKYIASQNDKPSVVLETDIKAYEFGEDFISFFPHDKIDINDDKVIFAGYGIEDPKYNDYAYQDVKDKIVLVVGGEPRDEYGNFIISNELDPYTGKTLRSVWSSDPIKGYILRRNAAMKHGAKAMLYYEPYYHDYFWKNFKKHFSKKQLEIAVKKDSVYDFLINKEIFADITGYDNPEDIKYTKKTRKYSVPIHINYQNKNDVIEGINTVGILEGDPESDEYVIVLSHYDGQGKHDGKIYPSANDNASGVAASMEMIRAFNIAKDSGFVPRRHLVFINFSGRQQDMIGSRFYVSHPVIPLDNTVAVVELHKMGRLKDLIDDDALPDFYPINLSFNGFNKDNFKKNVDKIQSYNDYITLKYKPLVEASDYTHFMKKKVPVIYFYGNSNFSGYHEPGDTADRVSFDILEKRTRFIFQIIWELAYQK